MLLAAPDPFGPATLGPRLQQALTDGWYRLLSVPVPVPYTRSFTDLPFLHDGGARGDDHDGRPERPPSRRGAPRDPGFGGSLVLGAGGPVTGTTLAAAYALAVLIFLVSVSPRARYRRPRRPCCRVRVVGRRCSSSALCIPATVQPAGRTFGAAHQRCHRTRWPCCPRCLETPGTPVLTRSCRGAADAAAQLGASHLRRL